jgi:hypothetical protein
MSLWTVPFRLYLRFPRGGVVHWNVPAVWVEWGAESKSWRSAKLRVVWGGGYTLQIVNLRAAMNNCAATACMVVCNVPAQEWTLSRTIITVPPFALSPARWSYLYEVQPLRETLWAGRRCVSCKQTAAGAYLLRIMSRSVMRVHKPFTFRWNISIRYTGWDASTTICCHFSLHIGLTFMLSDVSKPRSSQDSFGLGSVPVPLSSTQSPCCPEVLSLCGDCFLDSWARSCLGSSNALGCVVGWKGWIFQLPVSGAGAA